MKLKLNWGFGIAVTYTLFVIIVVSAVIFFMRQDVSLETNNYYSKGIKYQEQIDKIDRTNKLPEQLQISLIESGILFSFPKIFETKILSGKISFYRPSDEKKDFIVEISPDNSHTQIIASNELDKGLWKVKVDWNADGTDYYNEKLIMVN